MEKSRREVRRERRRQRQRQNQMRALGLIAVGALIIAGVLILPSLAPVGEIAEPPERNHPMADGNSLGDPEAPVEIVIYSDFQCAHCRNFYEDTEEQLIDTYVSSGEVHYTYRSFGDWLGEESLAAAEAAYCAGDQGKFWEYHNFLFANYPPSPNTGGYAERRLTAFADELGLDTGAFEDCLTSHKHQQRAMQDQEEGIANGVNGTPGFLVNGELLEGNRPFSDFQQLIEANLSGTDGG